MPRYYFHIKTDNGLIEDDTGLELGKGDLKEIRSAIRDVLSEPRCRRFVSSKCELQVCDAHKTTLLVVRRAASRDCKSRHYASHIAAEKFPDGMFGPSLRWTGYVSPCKEHFRGSWREIKRLACPFASPTGA